jgi:colicin import membrane protein
MEIVIFKELTNSGYLDELKAESKKYTGLYVDMEDAKQRKYVKDKASDIETIKKKVERARIDKSREYKVAVEKEAASILEDLTIANLPFALLIDDYAASRKVILDAEKALKQAVLLAEKKEADHEFALLMDEKFDNDILTAKREKLEYEVKLKAQAVLEIQQQNEALIAQQKQAVIDANLAELKNKWLAIELEAHKINDDIDAAIQRDYLAGVAEVKRLASIETERLAGIERQRVAQQAIDDEAARNLADVNHVRTINRAIYTSFIDAGLTKECATLATKALIDNKVSHTAIKY